MKQAEIPATELAYLRRLHVLKLQADARAVGAHEESQDLMEMIVLTAAEVVARADWPEGSDWNVNLASGCVFLKDEVVPPVTPEEKPN